MRQFRAGHIPRTGSRRVFGKKSAKKFVCNGCGYRFEAGEEGRMTAPHAYRHYPECPPECVGGGA